MKSTTYITTKKQPKSARFVDGPARVVIVDDGNKFGVHMYAYRALKSDPSKFEETAKEQIPHDCLPMILKKLIPASAH